MDTKRKHERYTYDLDVEVVFDDGESHTARMLNFSLGGAFLEMDSFPKFGSKVTLVMDLPGVPDQCRIPSFVRWIKEGSGTGIQFEYTRPIEVWALSKLIRKIKADSAQD